MLHTNLSTRPFYNTRAVQAVLGVVVLVVLAVTVLNVFRFVSLRSTERTLGADAAQNEVEAARLRTTADAIVRRLDQKELSAVSAEARRANTIIDQRTFSWSGLFGQLESVLPDDVRITAAQPRLEKDGAFILALSVQARRIEDVDAFIEALEMRAGFRNVLPAEEQTNDDGLIEAVIEGIYTPPASRGDAGPPTTARAEPQGGPRE